MRRWIVALLDPSPIEQGSKQRHTTIQMPPRFDVEKATTPAILPPTSSLRPTRARSSRSASPSKIATPSRKIASPRKSRATRSSAKTGAANGEEVVEIAKATESVEVATTPGAPSAAQLAVENGIALSDSVASSVNGEQKDPETVRIEVQETVEKDGDVETTTTNVKVDVPLDHPELPEPEDPTKMIENARRMVEEARALEQDAAGGAAASAKKPKRKADELMADDESEAAEERPAKQAKTVYTAEQRLKKERMTTKALVGFGIMAAIGFVLLSPTTHVPANPVLQRRNSILCLGGLGYLHQR